MLFIPILTNLIPMPNLNLTIQNVSTNADIPTKAQFRQWAKASIRVDCEATIRIVDEAEARELNLAYRGKDYATNVLTFVLDENPYLMGDIVMCAPVVVTEAAAQHKSIAAHFAHLTVHGMLHLHGYDHEKDAPAELMEALETAILAKLGYANPYLVT